MWNDMNVGMLYGFISTLLNAISYFRPQIIVVSFDSRQKTFRHELFPQYKAQRSKTPDDFFQQIPLVKEALRAFEIEYLSRAGYEADDIIGTVAKKLETEDFRVKILSGDLDFTQIVNDHIKLIKISGKIEQSPVYGKKEVEARFGVFRSK